MLHLFNKVYLELDDKIELNYDRVVIGTCGVPLADRVAGATAVAPAIGARVAALAGSTVIAGLRRRTPAIMRAAGWLMILAGIYAFLYGLAEVLQQFGIDALQGVFEVTLAWQGSLTRAVYGWGVPTLVTLAVLAGGIAVWVFGFRRHQRV